MLPSASTRNLPVTADRSPQISIRIRVSAANPLHNRYAKLSSSLAVRGRRLHLAAAGLLLAAMPFTVAAQSSARTTQALSSSCGTTGVVSLHTSSAGALALCEGRSLSTHGAVGTPLSLASADFDEDGVPDLVTGMALGSTGSVTIYRGNVAALWPYGAAIAHGLPEAFLPNPLTVSVAETPDLVVTGDFDADGHFDIVTAHHGSSVLYFLKGDGHGHFAAAKRIDVGGSITDLIAGEFNQPDGIADLIVAVSGTSGNAALIFESTSGGLNSQPKSYTLSHTATALALGRFSGTALFDLAVGGGSELTVIHGRSLHADPVTEAAPISITHQVFPFVVRALVAGDFTGTAPSLAALGDDGKIHILTHAVSADILSNMAAGSSLSMSAVAQGNVSQPLGASSDLATDAAQRVTAMQQLASSTSDGNEWTERSVIAMPTGFSQRAARLVAARITGSQQEDLLAVDSSNQQVHVLSTVNSTLLSAKSQAALSNTAPKSMSLQASLAATSEPVAILPMRLNQHGRNGLVSLVAGQSSPIIAPQDVPAAQTFTVTNTSDITDPSQKNSPPAGSLRAAMLAAQNQTSINSTNGSTATASVVFNIPTTDPGYNAATGIFTIKPISEAPYTGGSFQDPNALPPIYTAITIDGYTQPGASPNTLAAGDNAKILIQIDGSNATVPGASGLRPYLDTGTVIRGLAITGWKTPSIGSNNIASGGWGIEASGTGDFFEGNFIGTADGKTAAGNVDGVFVDSGPGFGNATGGNIVGGTTPRARNVISGNTQAGIILFYSANQAQVQGNFVGLNTTGTAVLPNGITGITGVQPTNTVGGTQAGARNYFAGNSNNVDINDVTGSGQETGGLVLGNYIGTDVTGTKGLSPNSGGVGIQVGPRNYIIGGTSPAARNLISGNNIGVFVAQNTFYNTILGNYIGTDPTGTVAVPNLAQGLYVGLSGSYTGLSPVPAGYTTIGGTTAGSGNLIAGNGSDGIALNGTSQNSSSSPYIGNTVQGNLIGTDVTGTLALPNQGNGVYITSGATNNTIGGTIGGAANLIANNKKNGVLIDPGTTAGPGVNNVTLGNTISANTGAGVRIVSGTSNKVSQNSIVSNGALGIDIDAAGPGTNTHCNTTNSGANKLQNYPVLTAGTGSTFISATATDPSGNTSEFSKTVQSTGTGNLLSLLGNFDSTPSTKFTIEFFANTAADASGYGQGQTYLGSTSVTTDANCSSAISDPVDRSQADVSVVLTKPTASLIVGPDFGLITYTATVANNGPAIAHSVTFTDTLPAQLQLSGTYCNVGACQSPIVTTQGTCSVSGKTITCTLGTMATGGTASIIIPVQVISDGTVTNTASVTATETDPNLLNNTSTTTATAYYDYPNIDHLNPTAVLINGPTVPLNIYGTGFVSASTVTFNNTNVPVTALVDNQVCGSSFSPSFCSILQVQIPASLLTTPGSYAVQVTNPNIGYSSSANFAVASACTYNVQAYLTGESASGTDLIAESAYVVTNVASCPWTSSSTLPWVTILDNTPTTGTGTVDITIAANTTTSARSGSITIAGQSVTVSQNAGSATNCTATLSATGASIAASGGTGSFTVTPSSSSCSPFVEPYPQNSTSTPNVQWITVPSNSLPANNTVTYTVAANNGPTRTGSITVGGSVYTITQSAPACVFTLTPGSIVAPASGTSGSIGVTATPSSCSYNATSSNTAQVSVTSGALGTGSGTVNYTVAANTSGPQTQTIAIGNAFSTSLFTISQAATNTCTFTLSPGSASLTSEGGSRFFTLTASFSFCKWTATSNNPDALQIVQGASGTGSGSVLFVVGQNAGAARTLTITAGCQTFTVQQAATNTVATNPVPALTSLQPSSTTAGSGAFTLTVNGTGFVSGAVVNFNGVARVTTYVGTTQLTAAILAADVTTAGPYPITVTNPAPGGGTSNALTFTVNSVTNNPTPTLTQLQPSSTTAGSGAFTLTVTGTGFVSGSTINFNGSARTTTYVSATQLTASILATDVATTGTPSVTVISPTPGGGTSNVLTFTINAANNPAPTLTVLQPSSTTAGSGAFTLTVNGTGFVSNSVINFNGNARTTTYVSATQLTASILATDVANIGTPSVTVTSPTPGGGTSNPLTFTINAANNPAPTLTVLQPSSTTAGSGAFTLTVTGTGFVSGSTINFNGNARTTTYVSATQLTAAILATDVANTGTPSVTVTSPTPGGGTSNALTFTITAANNPAPSLTTLQPATAAAGSGAFTLTVNGTNFLSTSTVNLNGSPRTTTFVSATQLTAAIPAADIATQGSASITVTNPAPGGGTSGVATLTITAPATTPSFILTSSATSQTVAAGGTVQYSLTVTAQNGTFPNPVLLSVTGLPSGATATFTPTSVTPGSTSATSVLTIQAPRTRASLDPPHAHPSWLAAIVPLFGLLLLSRKRHKQLTLMALLLLCSSAMLTGCGAGLPAPGSNQTSTLIVTGTYGTTQQSIPVQLTINY